MSEQQTHDQKQPPEQETPEPDPLEEARARIAQLEEGWRRAAAELDNFRKRCAKDLVRAREQERARTAAGWLPVVDNLERALEHASSDPPRRTTCSPILLHFGPLSAGQGN
jgi:molecular chaperone GrpE